MVLIEDDAKFVEDKCKSKEGKNKEYVIDGKYWKNGMPVPTSVDEL